MKKNYASFKKKNGVKKYLLSLFLFLNVCIGFAQTFEDGQLAYKVISGTNVGVDGRSASGTDANINVPSSVIYNSVTYTVTAIQDSAFDRDETLLSISLPEGLTTIGSTALQYTGITSITIPSSVTGIGNSALNIFNIREVIVLTDEPISFMEGAYPFDYNFSYPIYVKLIVPSLTALNNYKTATVWEQMGGIYYDKFSEGNFDYAFTSANQVALLGKTEGSDEKDIMVLNTVNYNGTAYDVVTIGPSAFRYDYQDSTTSIKSLVIGGNITTIEDWAFYSNQLTSLTIPAKVTNIGQNAFLSTQIVKITMLAEVPNISFFDETNPFKSQSITISLYVPSETAKNSYAQSTVWKDFENIYYGGFTEGDFDYTFVSSTEVTVLGRTDSSNITDIIIPTTVSNNENNYNVIDVAPYSFKEVLLNSLIISEGVVKIGTDAFYGCNLKSVKLPKTLSVIGDGSLQRNAFSSIIIPDNVTVIEDLAFYANSSLKEVTLGTKLTTIGEFSFGSTGLTSITIPSSVTEIGNYAFDRSPLANVYVQNETPINLTGTYNVFGADVSNINLYVASDDAKTAYEAGDVWKDFKSITVTVVSPAPTGLATQVYTGDDKTVANLAVTGTTITWYDAATNGNVLASSTALADETTYYASNTATASVESTTRLAVTVNRISANMQALTDGATVNDLVSTPSTGATAQWFTTNAGGSALSSTTVLTSGTYYVQQQNPESIETLGSGFFGPAGVSVQADRKILIADTDNNAIKRMDADGTNIETLGSGFSNPFGVSVQADGKILIADYSNSAIKRMDADGTNIQTLGSGFSGSAGVSVQADGKILIADFFNNAIKRMDADGTNIQTLGSGFSSPTGVSVQADGKILIADFGNNAIKRMDADGTNIQTLGSGFSIPTGVSVQADGKILIADRGNNAIKRMDADGTNIQTLGSGFSEPFGVSVQADGKILIADRGNNAIKRYTEASTSNRVAVTVTVTVVSPAPTGLATQVYTGDDKTIANLAVTGTTITWYDAATNGNVLASSTALADETTYYASNTATASVESTTRLAVTVNRISANMQALTDGATVNDLVSTPSTGATAQWFTTNAGGSALSSTTVLTSGTYYVQQQNPESIETLGSGFSSPSGVSVQADGKILIADTANNAIKRMDADGTNIETLGSGFSSPTGVSVQADGKILIADYSNSAIKRMDADGTNIQTLGSGFSGSAGVSVQADGKILIADFFNNAIKRMDADGTNIQTLGSGFSGPTGVFVQADGKILIADFGNDAIKRMDADGTNIQTLGSGFSEPFGVSVQADGKILIADTGNDAIKRMDADGTNIQTLGSGFSSPYGVPVQADGKILIADRGNNAIKRYTEASTSNRVAVTVTVTVVSPAPTGLATQVYTGDDKTIANLAVTGTTITWYDAATNGNVLASTTALADETTYYASNTATASVESTTRLAVTVNRISANMQALTDGATVNDLVSTPSTGATAQWFTTNAGGSALSSTTVLTSGTYYVQQQNPESIETLGSGFSSPYGVPVQADGKILIADRGNNAIKRYTEASTSNRVAVTVTVATLGTNEFALLTQLSTIFPNPSNGNFTLSYSGQEKLKQLTVFDITGKKVQTILLTDFNKSKEISLTSLAQGMYSINIESETANTTKRMIIK